MGERLSPLVGYADRFAEAAVRSAGAVRFEEQPFPAQIDLRLDPDGPAAARVGRALGLSLPGEPGTSAAAGRVRVLSLGPDEWLVIGPTGHEVELATRLDAAVGAEHGSVVDVSAYRTSVLVAGTRSRDVLAHGCALDLHPRVFGPGRCAQTMLARAQVVLLAGGVPTPAPLQGRTADEGFTVLVGASFAGYVADWLVDAATEYVPDDQPGDRRRRQADPSRG